MTKEMKAELLNLLNNHLKSKELTDYNEEQVNIYLSVKNKLSLQTAVNEYYESVEEMYNTYSDKIEELNKTSPVDWILNHYEDKDTDAVYNYRYVKVIYDSNKSTCDKCAKELNDLNEKYKNDLESKEYHDKKIHLMRILKDNEAVFENTKKDYEQCVDVLKASGTEKLDSELEKYQKRLEDINVYKNIDKVIHTPSINPDSVNKALACVKEAYDAYHNNHSFFGRMFKWTTAFSAGRDYKDFCDIRDAFKEHVGNVINMENVNAYLDNKISLEEFNNRSAASITVHMDSLKPVENNHKNSVDMDDNLNKSAYTEVNEYEYDPEELKKYEEENKKQIELKDNEASEEEYEYFLEEENNELDNSQVNAK